MVKYKIAFKETTMGSNDYLSGEYKTHQEAKWHLHNDDETKDETSLYKIVEIDNDYICKYCEHINPNEYFDSDLGFECSNCGTYSDIYYFISDFEKKAKEYPFWNSENGKKIIEKKKKEKELEIKQKEENKKKLIEIKKEIEELEKLEKINGMLSIPDLEELNNLKSLAKLYS